MLGNFKFRVGFTTAMCASALVLVGCDTKQAAQPAIEPEPAIVDAEAKGLGFNTDYVDASVKPYENFYRHANGRWLDSAKIADDRTQVSMFSELADRNYAKQRTIIEGLSDLTDDQLSHADKQLVTLYYSFIEPTELTRQTEGYLTDTFAKIDQITSKEQLPSLFVDLLKVGVAGPVQLMVEPDSRNPNHYILELYQSGTSIRDRRFYLRDDSETEDLRTAYAEMIVKGFELAGFNEPKVAADQTIAIEAKIAAAQWTKKDSLDRNKSYNLYSRSRMKNLSSDEKWSSVFELLSGTKQRYIRVYQPSYLSKLTHMIDDLPLEHWQNYLKWQVINQSLADLDTPYQQLHQQFYGEKIGGRIEQQQDWKFAISSINKYIGDAMAARYVEQYFSDRERQRVQHMVQVILDTTLQDLDTRGWMQDTTKARAKAKIVGMSVKVGYPDHFDRYQALKLVKGDKLENLTRLKAYQFKQTIKKLNRSVSPDDWYRSPQSVAAYYNPAGNEIVFPAGILVKPFFDAEADDAANYGGIGTLIGHEIAHAIDKIGADLDESGLEDKWWQPADYENFDHISNRLGAQLADYQILPDLKIGNHLNSDEATADLLGVELSYAAYVASLKGKSAPVIDGYTGSERFFMSYAQAWRNKMREDYLRRVLPYFNYAPGEARVNVTLKNVDAFRRTYSVKQRNDMYIRHSKRANIW